MLEGIEVFLHSSIKINKGKIIYIDPFRINKDYKDADVIMITHSHYDHYSEEDINKIKKDDTVIVVTEDLSSKVSNMGFKEIITVEPNKTYLADGIKFETVPAYNINKQFHPKVNDWVGYIIELNNIRYYIAGDTDINEDNKKVICDVALVPIGGTYTMTYEEAAILVNDIKPKIVIPTHYGELVGTKQDATKFEKLIDKNIECRILIR